MHGTSKNSPNAGHPVPGDGRRDGPPFLPTGRSLSTSPPRRADPPAAGKLQLVAVGNRFCLARQDEAKSARPGQLSPADAVGKGERAAPGRGDSVDPRRAGGSAGWPAALRSRSSSDEGSIHRYFYLFITIKYTVVKAKYHGALFRFGLWPMYFCGKIKN